MISATEQTPLLDPPRPHRHIPNNNTSEHTFAAADFIHHRDPVVTDDDPGRRQRRGMMSCKYYLRNAMVFLPWIYVILPLLVLAAILLASGVMELTLSSFVTTLPPPTTLGSSPSATTAVSSPAKTITTTTTTTTTTTSSLRDLAQSMMPSYYMATWQQAIPVLTQDVEPSDVYACRKLLLQTRDLLDVFSVVYPNSTTSLDNGSPIDLWEEIRNLLDVGYTVIGEFQDLDHAHIQYTNDELEKSRNIVLQWRHDFELFHNGSMFDSVFEYLRTPLNESYRHRESRLFWKTMSIVPAGRDDATQSLMMLGSGQATRALKYLKLALPYKSVLGSSAHDHYHNLRKELRSLTDEYDMLGTTMYPSGSAPIVKLLKKARQLLGDINDDWTAYDTYAQAKILPYEQKRLAIAIDESWHSFGIWVEKVDLDGALEDLLRSMTSIGVSEHDLSLQEFLLQRQKHPTTNFVIGNEAGDADTIISAICLAYIESTKQHADTTPIVAISKDDLMTKRPEVVFLLKFAGISPRSLLCVDEPFVQHTKDANVTLTDHNVLSPLFQEQSLTWSVVEIVDHHQDQGYYLETCSGEARTIAFANDTALVASACTLVAERLFDVWPAPYPASLGALLMGVILLDSVNFSPEVGKVTQRDRDAVARLSDKTNWSELSSPFSKEVFSDESQAPDPTLFFNALQKAKYDINFWSSLTVLDALKLDYKSFSITNSSQFGISTVLMPADSFLSKSNVSKELIQYMTEANVSFLSIMFAFEMSGNFQRQLALFSIGDFPMADLVSYLMNSDMYSQETLDLRERTIALGDNLTNVSLRLFEQRNVAPSRKQIGPILEHFFELKQDRRLTSS